MPPRSRRQTEPQDDRNSRRPARKSGGSGVGTAAGFAVVAVLAIGIAGYLNGKKKDAKEKESAAQEQTTTDPAKDPFAGIHEEPPTPGSSKRATSMRVTDDAPDGLMATKLWLDACKVAKQAELHAAKAREAKAKDDYSTFNTEGKLAKEGFDEAFTMTAEWEEELLDLYGDLDRQVRLIVRERNEWIDQVRVFHKTTSK